MATLDVITLDEATQALNVFDQSQDAELTAYITAVSLRLDKLVGPIVNRTITNEIHDGGAVPTNVIALNFYPVSSITSVLERQSTVSQTIVAENFAAPTSLDYVLVANQGLLYRRTGGQDSNWWQGRGNVVVTYVAGRFADTASVDYRFKQAAAIMLTHLWRGEQGASSATFGGQDASANLLIPTFAVPNAVVELLSDQVQTPAFA